MYVTIIVKCARSLIIKFNLFLAVFDQFSWPASFTFLARVRATGTSCASMDQVGHLVTSFSQKVCYRSVGGFRGKPFQDNYRAVHF